MAKATMQKETATFQDRTQAETKSQSRNLLVTLTFTWDSVLFRSDQCSAFQRIAWFDKKTNFQSPLEQLNLPPEVKNGLVQLIILAMLMIPFLI